ncbi:hypothetical protein LC608_31410 [Nostoc sp. XA010]|uniref:hypothetical protein n=1 Tax=Nostoc sp. XA010 TaxID=2780407 RepID=UPI001E46960B|nr:hypothetical protein [Nostoc sp. XA010]MCC5661384.1 hypothetical protein [Nostoc sp. XA010]
MVKEPGNLSDLEGLGKDEWDRYVSEQIKEAIEDSKTSQFLPNADGRIISPPVAVDWSGFPIRLQTCLDGSFRKTLRFLDWQLGDVDAGRPIGHEEYLEWRVVRNGAGKIIRMEFTTEVREYWEILAKYHPTKCLRLLGRFAGERIAAFEDVYGLDPEQMTPEERLKSFQDNMFAHRDSAPKSPYNNGRKAIAFMCKGVNTLRAAIQLASFAAFPYQAEEADGTIRSITGSEAIAFTTQNALDCRNSDPTIVSSVIDLAVSGQYLTLDDPPGVYILDVQHEKILLPDRSSSIPSDWFEFQRGSRTEGERSQRLVFEVPPSQGFTISDLVDEEIDDPIAFGGQIAKKILVGLYVRVSSPGAASVTPTTVKVSDLPTNRCACDSIKAAYSNFESIQNFLTPVSTVMSGSRRIDS